MAQDQSSPPWSDLPPEIVGLVFLRLPTRFDRAFFPAVCRQWRSDARLCRLPPPSPMPWLVLSTSTVISFPHGETFHLPEGTRYHSSSGEWILLSRDDNSCFLMNPFTKATMPLPSLSSYNHYDEPVEVADDCIVPDHEMPGTWMYNMDLGEISVLSLIMCSTNLIAVIDAIGDLGTIALCRPGAAAWSGSAHEECRWLSHMVYFQGKLYAIDVDNEDLLAFDIVDEHGSDEPRVSRIECIIKRDNLPPQHHFIRVPYLLESHGTLLMIRRKISTEGDTIYRFGRRDCILVAGSSEFEVHKPDYEHLLWAEVMTLGNDQALFIGKGCSRAVQVSPYDLSRDCIFFLDDYTDWLWKKITISCGVYDMKDGKVYSPMPMVSWNSGDIPATWLFSQGKTDKLQITGGASAGNC